MFEAGNNKKYKINNIQNCIVYTKKLIARHLLELYSNFKKKQL